jgi:hypothetical protein
MSKITVSTITFNPKSLQVANCGGWLRNFDLNTSKNLYLNVSLGPSSHKYPIIDENMVHYIPLVFFVNLDFTALEVPLKKIIFPFFYVSP